MEIFPLPLPTVINQLLLTIFNVIDVSLTTVDLQQAQLRPENQNRNKNQCGLAQPSLLETEK